MKITAEHYTIMASAIGHIVNPDRARIEAYRNQLANDTRVKNLAMRFRWDLLHAAKLSQWLCDNVYPYANDEHIDTALRSIMRELKLEN